MTVRQKNRLDPHVFINHTLQMTWIRLVLAMLANLILFELSWAAKAPLVQTIRPPEQSSTVPVFIKSGNTLTNIDQSSVIFDLPVTYNSKVKRWIRFYQNDGKVWFRRWLERSNKYVPAIQRVLTRKGLPKDLAYIAMIESGFSSRAVSSAQAVGPWQFIDATAKRYGLKINWWIDERRDFHKSTLAASNYIQDLYRIFNSWYLVAASYNMGENGVKRAIARHKTKNYWELTQKGALSIETTNYVPKLLAAMIISKAPGLYGFRKLRRQVPVRYDNIFVPGGTDLVNLAKYLGVTKKFMMELNPELVKEFVPRFIGSHQIRIPKGSLKLVTQYLTTKLTQQAQN